MSITVHDSVDVEHDRQVEPPGTFRLLLEGRATGELLTTLALRPLLRRLGKGDGHPVLLLPGFLAGDLSTRPLRAFLRDLDYWAHRWNLGRNLGSSEELEARMHERLVEIHEQHGRRVSLIGWSLGGVYARVLANRQPDLVRSVIMLGSPFARNARANQGWRLYEWLTDQKIDEIPAERMAEVRRTPPVPTTSIFSRSDGIAAWQTSIQPEGPHSESIEAAGSHLGLGFNPLVLYAVADRLAEPEGGWRPFFRPGVKRPPGLRRPPEARAGGPGRADGAAEDEAAEHAEATVDAEAAAAAEAAPESGAA